MKSSKTLLMTSLSAFLFMALSLQSCLEDDADITVSYSKGTPIYGDMETIRNTPLFESTPRVLVNPGKIFVSEDYLLIGEEGKGIHILDNKNPQNPTHLAFLNIPGNREFYFDQGMIYAESYYDMLKIDFTDPGQPALVARVEEAFSEALTDQEGRTLLGFEFENVTEELSKNDDYYDYMNAYGVNYIIHDYASNLIPPSAVPASFSGNSASSIGSVNRIVAHRDHIYAVSRAKLLVLENKEGLTKVAHENVSWRGDMETIYPLGDRLFIGASTEMMIVDISNPEMPNYLSNFSHATSCDPVYPTDNGVAYVTLRTGDFAECPGDENALVVLDVDDVQRPEELQDVEMESPYGLTLIGETLYVGEGENGMKVFDASNPRKLKQTDWVKDIQAYDVLAHPTNENILLIAGPQGLSQYQVSEDYDHLSTIDFL